MTKAKKAVEKSVRKPTILVYCGPTIPHICSRFSMFSAVPDALEEKAKEVPLIRNLILPIGEFCAARQQIEGKTGPLFTTYQQVQKAI